MSEPVLTVVMPVRNEGGIIEGIVGDWLAELDALGVSHILHVYDDGSHDGTTDVLERVARRHNAMRVSYHSQRGHGPTVLRGYREASSEWVMQADSDGEISAREFADLWAARDAADLVLGARIDRVSGVVRRFVTTGARLMVRVCFGARVQDANCPFRLFRRSVLDDTLPFLPPEAFAPNMLLVGAATARGWRVVECTVRSGRRAGGVSSLRVFGLASAVVVSVLQAAGTALRMKRGTAHKRRGSPND